MSSYVDNYRGIEDEMIGRASSKILRARQYIILQRLPDWRDVDSPRRSGSVQGCVLQNRVCVGHKVSGLTAPANRSLKFADRSDEPAGDTADTTLCLSSLSDIHSPCRHVYSTTAAGYISESEKHLKPREPENTDRIQTGSVSMRDRRQP